VDNKRTPDLRFYTVLRVGIEKMQLEILFQFFDLYYPSVFINQGHFFGRYIPIVGDTFILFYKFYDSVTGQTITTGIIGLRHRVVISAVIQQSGDFFHNQIEIGAVQLYRILHRKSRIMLRPQIDNLKLIISSLNCE
jgi:hypothetical protein